MTANPQSAAIYCRVSSSTQDLVGQIRELEAEAARRGLAIVERYIEKVSGTGRVERGEYERLLARSRDRDRPWLHLFVWALDRFSRDATFTRATQSILDIESHGVLFHSLKEPTLDTPEDGKPNLGRDVLLALLPVIASFESKRRSERVKVAMKEIKEGRRRTRSGRPPGRPRRVTEEHSAKAEALRNGGLSWALVAQRVGLPKETCRRAVYERKLARRAVGNSGVGEMVRPQGEVP